MGDPDRSWSAQVSAIAALGEPARRRLYEHVVRQPAPVSKDEAAEAVGTPRTTAAFHLDKLVAEGLLDVVHERRTGRSGPGAGRPAKLYRRAPGQIAVSLPESRYELAAGLLADAFAEAETSARPPGEVLREQAEALGRRLGAAGRGGDAERAAVLRMLEATGFEPRAEAESVLLANCPFHSLAQRHTALVCGMNLCLVRGLLAGLAASGFTARLAPEPPHCCVRVEPAEAQAGRHRSTGLPGTQRA